MLMPPGSIMIPALSLSLPPCPRYGSAIESDLVTSSIQCLPPLEGIIDSHNVSVVLANRGMAYVRPEDNLVALDNKLRPYHFQTHAGTCMCLCHQNFLHLCVYVDFTLA